MYDFWFILDETENEIHGEDPLISNITRVPLPVPLALQKFMFSDDGAKGRRKRDDEVAKQYREEIGRQYSSPEIPRGGKSTECIKENWQFFMFCPKILFLLLKMEINRPKMVPIVIFAH